MKLLGSIAILLALVTSLLVDSPADGTESTSGSYHERFPFERGPGDLTGHTMSLPAPQDPATADAMTTAGVAMIESAASMADAAVILLRNGDSALSALGEHWAQDARTLATRGDWMITTATSDGMVHDPDNARSINLANLEANGVVMIAEGTAMVQQGRVMLVRIEDLRASGVLGASSLGKLSAAAELLIATGETATSDGTRMRDAALRLRQSLAQ